METIYDQLTRRGLTLNEINEALDHAKDDEMKIPQYIAEMSDEEFLESLDDYGVGWVYIHEAAKRIRDLKSRLEGEEEDGD